MVRPPSLMENQALPEQWPLRPQMSEMPPGSYAAV